ncbi:class IV adenylate cyclase [Patulibacter sp. SYSU D01012]|uniref:class IV adenylate cyclase n=1 Tax=Patulibacter sp. SYSU D01012 TaxID=2817381 RepID=UPI001B3082BA
MTDPRRNVELKAHDGDPARSLAVCRALGAEDRGVLEQRDTYFRARRGRLKLRDETPGTAHLVAYERADAAAARTSTYRIAGVTDAGATRAALEATLGVTGEVRKTRRLLLWGGVRIHLDEVRGLGPFVELEAVAGAESDLRREHALVSTLREHLAITDDRLCAGGYAALLGLEG